MKKNIFLIFFCGIFVVVGITMSFICLNQKNSNDDFIKNSKTTQATIIDINTRITGSGDDRKTEHDVFVSFYVDDKKYEGEINSYKTGMHVGNRIEIYYNLDDPDDFLSKSDANGIIVGIILGIIFALVGMIPIFVMIMNSVTKKMITRNGECIQAQIDAVQMNTIIRVNGRHPWNIYCSYFDPMTGEKHLFKSKNFYGEYTGAFEQAGITTINVYIKSGNYKKYYVDYQNAIDMLASSSKVFIPENY